jgi:hypothetical protein
MKVQVRKQWSQWAEIEVEDGLSQKERRSQAMREAAKIPKPAGMQGVDWVGTEFFIPGAGFFTVEGVSYEEWFDI